MVSSGKRSVLGILIDAVDYEAAVSFVFECVQQKRGGLISAVAVHGVMSGVLDPEHKFRLNNFDLLVPDGQPVRWVMNWRYGTRLSERVYGPELMRKICKRAAVENTPIYLYGSTRRIATALTEALTRKLPGLRIVGSEPSAFRKLSPIEHEALRQRINSSGASIVFVGLGCPRQEIFAYELRRDLSVPMLAVGAAFPFLAGISPQAPRWMQRCGLEWLFRLLIEPRRLWRRYLLLNPAYLLLVALEWCGVKHFSDRGRAPIGDVLVG